MAPAEFDPDGLVQAKRLLNELDDDAAADPRLIRVLRIFADQLEMLRED